MNQIKQESRDSIEKNMSNKSPLVVLGPSSALTCSSSLKTLPDPSDGKGRKYLFLENQVYELSSNTKYPSSWFVNNQVYQDGSIRMLTPVHPLFFCISFLRQKKYHNYMSVEDLFISSSFPDIRELGKLPCIEDQLPLICEVQKISDQCYYKYNHDLCLKWLHCRTEKIRQVIKEDQPMDSLCILSQYIGKDLLEEVCNEFQVKLSQLVPKQKVVLSCDSKKTHNKRSERSEASESQPAKIARKSGKSVHTAQNAASGCSKNSITAFFKSKSSRNSFSLSKVRSNA